MIYFLFKENEKMLLVLVNIEICLVNKNFQLFTNLPIFILLSVFYANKFVNYFIFFMLKILEFC